MLEFQEGFFDQEVRDGFYLDTTMKTLWAAELEVLQKVAEVCDRHGLKWYAAYGTLLGAIRHEGFVPWDDDMDIWVKRADYNILMQVLPKELPEGYLVRGPLTDEGYDQYHTCLNSGNGISIAKEWLEQYHGCPFTVGLDIFPLDYLPRNEKDRDLQVQLLTMTGRIAQLAKNLSRGDYDTKEDETEVSEGEEDNREKEESIDSSKTGDKQEKATTLKEEIIEEINLGIDYLEENCKLQVDHQLLEDENWGSLSSEIWKWANYLAMMYSEEESDYLVEFFDYIQMPHKKYPKEWFGDGYCASFEGFMIPVPSGYEDVLRHVYGEYYMCCCRKGGTHEYPYYARQLRQLREYVKDIQQRAQDAGLVSIDEIEVKEETKELLPEWIPLTRKADGSCKKVVLSANDTALYAAYGDKALDRLEQRLQIFEQVKDSVLLWWRPHPVMIKVLSQISMDLGERYQSILNRYRKSGWGICDETDNVDRAVEVCDIYYGDMNAIIQPFQNVCKPIMLAMTDCGAEWEQAAFSNNEGRKEEFRVFLSASDFVDYGGKIYFANTNYNVLAVINKETRMLEEHIPFIETLSDTSNMHMHCAHVHNKIYFLPAGVQYLHIYDMESGEQKVCCFLEEMDASDDTRKNLVRAQYSQVASWSHFIHDERIYLLPCYARQSLWSIQAHTDAPEREFWWKNLEEETLLKHGEIDKERFYTLAVDSDSLYITNVEDKTVESITLPDEHVANIAFDGVNFWYTMNGTRDIVCWNRIDGIVDRYFIQDDICPVCLGLGYRGICFAKGNLFLVSADNAILCMLDQDKRELRQLYYYAEFRKWSVAGELMPYFKCTGKTLVCMYQNTDVVIIVDLQTLQAEKWNQVVEIEASIEREVHEYEYKVMMDRNALLFEEEKDDGLQVLLNYCTENNECLE